MNKSPHDFSDSEDIRSVHESAIVRFLDWDFEMVGEGFRTFMGLCMRPEA